jgi:hypothetical protein
MRRSSLIMSFLFNDVKARSHAACVKLVGRPALDDMRCVQFMNNNVPRRHAVSHRRGIPVVRHGGVWPWPGPEMKEIEERVPQFPFCCGATPGRRRPPPAPARALRRATPSCDHHRMLTVLHTKCTPTWKCCACTERRRHHPSFCTRHESVCRHNRAARCLYMGTGQCHG